MKVVIVGQGGHSKVVTEAIAFQGNLKIIGYLDDNYNELVFENELFYGPIRSNKELLLIEPNIKFIIAIGNNKMRKVIVEKLGLKETQFISVIHPKAIISTSAIIGVGSVILANAVVNTDATIGAHTIINTSAIVEHDNIIEDFAHLSPNATLTGTVHIEEGVHVGAGANIIPNISIGKWSTIGAGATVINHIPAFSTAVGVPAKIKAKEGDEVVAINIQ
ncbi:acetyltransferase [Sutcliffiella horikoshii]|uniref:acetyltransferase n=1 Tax=Sutcliffiella horikoshii TaxID=79883 RepID=UPI002467AF1D|nr:acetyltransferase [Sutcliffiella horikoshii]